MGIRIAKRAKVNVAVRLYNRSFGYFDAITTDVSDSGFFINTKPYLGLQENSEQQMVLLDSSMSDVIFNVEFVRESEHGLGFRFIDFEQEGVRRELDELKPISAIKHCEKHALIV